MYQQRIRQFLETGPRSTSQRKFHQALTVSQQYSNQVPKIIMQTWKTDQIPEQWSRSPGSFQKYHPDWHYILMTDQDNFEFTELFFPDMVTVYQNLQYPIMRADMIRYMFLYVIGGLYVDLDYQAMKNLTPLLTQVDAPSYFVNSGNISIITNSVMASKPGSPIWLEMIQYIDTTFKNPPWWFINKHFKVMGTTGPMALQQVLNQTSIPYGMLPQRLIIPCNVCQLEKSDVCLDDQRYLQPLKGLSWNGADTQLLNTLFCHPEELIVAGIIFLVILLLILIYIWRHGSPTATMIFLGVIVLLLGLMFLPKIFSN